ncbi:MAG: hypothetical protein K0R17_1024 [Rariglobus sp.]|jgi:hypothetical protein|nr:hypothetical protein [Rariglobus sp.]
MSCACTINALLPFTLDYFAGDTVGIKATITDPADAPYPLTDCGLAFFLTDPTATDPTARLWDMTIGSGIAILSLSGGTAMITPTLAQSQALTAGKTYTARCILTDAAGAIITAATGYIETL